jgi:hypothetical protein
MEESGEQWTVVFALIVKEPLSKLEHQIKLTTFSQFVEFFTLRRGSGSDLRLGKFRIQPLKCIIMWFTLGIFVLQI